MAIGNLTQNPENKKVGEYTVTTFGLAINDIVYSNQEKKKLVTFIDVETWGRQAENCAKYLEKGKRILLEGKIRMNTWEKDGKKRSKLYCIADKVVFLNGDSSDEAKPSSESKPDKKDIKKQEEVENSDSEDSMDDIPF